MDIYNHTIIYIYVIISDKVVGLDEIFKEIKWIKFFNKKDIICYDFYSLINKKCNK